MRDLLAHGDAVGLQLQSDLRRQDRPWELRAGHAALENLKTSSSAIAEGPRDALSQLKSCQLLHNCTRNHI